MKKIILTVIAVAIGYCIAYPQPCLPEGITFTTQAQINNFQNNYPGCTEIEGNVQITGYYNITNLNGLNVLNSIGGNLVFQESFALTSLTGLENLTTIGGGIWIESNYTLASLTGLDNLSTMGGNLFIFYNSLLEDLTALDNLQASTIGNLYIVYNSVLSGCNAQSLCYYLVAPHGKVEIHDNAPGCNSQLEIEELCNIQPCLPEGITFTTQEQMDNFQTNYPGCTEIEGDVTINGWESDITNLNGLSVVTSIGGDLEVYSTSITNFTGMDALTFISGSLYIGIPSGWYIYDNQLLTGLTGLNALTTIGGSLQIMGNPLLSSLNGLENLISIGDDFDLYSTSIVNFMGLENLNSIGDEFSITGNGQLNGLIDLENLTFLGGLLYISNNPMLHNLLGLDGLTSIGGIDIEGNDALTDLSGLDNINSIEGYLKIDGNNALTNLEGLGDLTSIGGAMVIWFNNALVSFAGLENLTSISDEFILQDNDNLVSLSALENLTSVPELLITWNPILPSLSGLDNINPDSLVGITLVNNWELSTCDIQSICDYLAGPNPAAYIQLNGPGCNSQAQIEQACLTTVEELETRNGITIIPNPSNDKIAISLSPITENTLLSIFHVSGEKVIEMQITETETQIDISTLPRGVYFVRVQNEKMVELGKMVKE